MKPALITLALFAAGMPAYATHPPTKIPPTNPPVQATPSTQTQTQTQGQQQSQGQQQTANPTASNSLTYEVAGQAPDVFFAPNNNTENCLRVFGIGGSTVSGGVVLGIPYRSRDCDLNGAAEDAFRQGQFLLGWELKCKTRSLRRAYGSEEACVDATMPHEQIQTRERERERERVIVQQCEERIARCELESLK